MKAKDSACGRCFWASEKRNPGPEPIIPEPGFFSRIFGEDRFDRWNRTRDWRWWNIDREDFERNVWCRRFPEPIDKRKDDYCGEFLASAIETRRAETQSGSVEDESAVSVAETPVSHCNPENHHGN